MSQNRRPAARIDRARISTAYGEKPETVAFWIRLFNFPAPVAEGVWDAQQVDDWVKGNRPQSWPAKAAVPDTASAEAPTEEATVAATGSDEAEHDEQLLGKAGLARRYEVSDSAVDTWTKVVGAGAFPAEVEPGKWRSADVDTWVQEHRAHVWAEITGAGPKVVIAPPEGDPKDLYDISGYGVILGNATRGRPLPRATMVSYKHQGHLEPPDRKPGDRKRPEVFELMWFLETIRRHVYSRRGQGRVRAGRARRGKR